MPRKSHWAPSFDAALLAVLGVCTFFSLKFGVLGEPFIPPSGGSRAHLTDRTYVHTATQDYDWAISIGRVPFSADSLLHFSLALTFVVIPAAIYLPSRGTRSWTLWLLGFAFAFVVALVSLILEIVWLRTGVPYSNYLRDTSQWRYAWPIIAATIWSAFWATGLLLHWLWPVKLWSEIPRRTIRDS